MNKYSIGHTGFLQNNVGLSYKSHFDLQIFIQCRCRDHVQFFFTMFKKSCSKFRLGIGQLCASILSPLFTSGELCCSSFLLLKWLKTCGTVTMKKGSKTWTLHKWDFKLIYLCSVIYEVENEMKQTETTLTNISQQVYFLPKMERMYSTLIELCVQ